LLIRTKLIYHFTLDLSFRNVEEIQMKKYSKILLLTIFGFTGTVAIAEEIPPEATAAAEAQQAALDYQQDNQSKAPNE
jgi:hypothetical protein